LSENPIDQKRTELSVANHFRKGSLYAKRVTLSSYRVEELLACSGLFFKFLPLSFLSIQQNLVDSSNEGCGSAKDFLREGNLNHDTAPGLLSDQVKPPVASFH
jgi:hypothetical protein